MRDAGGRADAVGPGLMTTLEDVVPDDHPLARDPRDGRPRPRAMSPEPRGPVRPRGRPSIAPEYLLRAELSQILYAIPSERRLVEELRYNLLLRWFVGLPLDEPVFHADELHQEPRLACSRRSSRRLLRRDPSRRAEAHKLLWPRALQPGRHPVEAAAALKSLRPLMRRTTATRPRPAAGRNPDVDFHGDRRANATHRSTTDPEARLARKGRRQGGQALLRRPYCLPRTATASRRSRAHPGQRHGRARGRPAPAGPPARGARDGGA